jgi:hypothetical protein
MNWDLRFVKDERRASADALCANTLCVAALCAETAISSGPAA